MSDVLHFYLKIAFIAFFSKTFSSKNVVLGILVPLFPNSEQSQGCEKRTTPVLLRSSCPQVFLKILQTSLKKRLWQRCFTMNFPKFLRTPFFIDYLRWLFLAIQRPFPITSFWKLSRFQNISFLIFEIIINSFVYSWYIN